MSDTHSENPEQSQTLQDRIHYAIKVLTDLLAEPVVTDWTADLAKSDSDKKTHDIGDILSDAANRLYSYNKAARLFEKEIKLLSTSIKTHKADEGHDLNATLAALGAGLTAKPTGIKLPQFPA
jgi:hypothetical protein